MTLVKDLGLFLFPSFCLLCSARLYDVHSVLCFHCESRLPRNRFTDLENNPVSQIFWGRVPVRMATSLFRFEKKSPYQALLHELKYKGNRKAGFYLGTLMGHMLKGSAFAECDLIIPVPLHKKKRRKRGYNQSELLARGSARVLDLPVETRCLEKTKFIPSQTNLGRYERFENVNQTFRLSDRATDLNGKKIILIDDVVTTGATLESCCETLLEQFDCELFIATAASA